MINFDAVDFSECRSEEVISFFWRSVYIEFCVKYTCPLNKIAQIAYNWEGRVFPE